LIKIRANGYLLDQFLHDNVNARTDEYGGSIEGRAKFTLEVIKSVTDAIGADRTGIRLSPYNYYQDTKDSDPNTHWAYVCEQIAAMPKENRLSYVHMVEARFDEVLSEEAKLESLGYGKTTVKAVGAGASRDGKGFSLTPFRRICQKEGVKFLAAGGYNRDNAVPALDADGADLIVMGKWFLANPDLHRRLAEGLPLNQYDRSTFYGADPLSKGYTDYPFWSYRS
jgi:2,4-dienoyl-CoA reductase-like NADH-dependent reductase (Old Yellow Enzyme family)